MEKKPTVGQKALELQQKNDQQHPVEVQREVHKEFIENLEKCVARHKKIYDGDFFVIIETKKERTLKNVVRNYFFGRLTCPTPNYDQSVYKYTHSDNSLQYLWTIPDRETCHILKDNALYIHPEEKELLKMVLEFDDGTLFKLCKKLNKEKLETPELEKG